MAKFSPCQRRTFLLCAFLLSTLCVDSLLLQYPAFGKRHRRIALASSSGDSEKNVDDMRRLLESSWNAATMGIVPTNADSAADATVGSLQTAMERGSTSIFLVNILLPQYDISRGDLLYDEVLAVEFCIALANRIEGKSSIVVRDDKTVQTVTRILDARERDRLQSGNIDVKDEDDDDDDDDSKALESKDDVEFYDDFADFESSGDADSFREQLMSTWETPAVEAASPRAPIDEPTPVANEAQQLSKRYRLASMLGDATTIYMGDDMINDVMKVVAANAQPKADEDTLIILSAASKEEMIGVRVLAAKFEGKKTIILVNFKLDPLPRELKKAETVYSILPLIARATVSELNIFGSEPKEDPKPTKIVVLRRYPRDWEVHVDSGNGFELAASVPAGQVGRNGPSVEWIAGRVKQHLKSRIG
jgi:hypothetical protein